MNSKFLYVKIKKIKNSNIDFSQFPNLPNNIPIFKMREQWGDDAKIIKTGKFSYKVDEATFQYFKTNNKFKILEEVK